MELLLERMEHGSRRVWSAKRRAGLAVWLGWISTLLRLDNKMKNEVLIKDKTGRFLIIRKDFVGQCGHNKFEVVAPRRNPGFFLIVHGREGSSI